jgi:hypothetical protein
LIRARGSAEDADLPPGLEDDDRDGIRQVEAAVTGEHR